MPPKGSKKVAVKASPPPPSTPGAESGDEGQAPATPATGTKAKTPRKRAVPKVVNHLPTDASGAAPIDVTYESSSVISSPLAKGGYSHSVKLTAPQSFELVASFMLDNGLQAVIIKPSAPFPFMKLPVEVRGMILRLILTPAVEKGNKAGNRIDFSSDKSGAVKAKGYTKDWKHRLAIAGVNKQLATEARQLFYGSFKLRFDNNTTLLTFLSQAGNEVREAISRITIVSYLKPTALAAMNLLAECSNLTNVLIIGGVGANMKPEKAAKAFFAEAGRLLQAIATRDDDKDAPLKVVTFGKNSLTTKEEDEHVRWDDDEVEEFDNLIIMKLK